MDLTIEKLIYGGDGLARLPADEKGPGKAVFVPFVLPGEKVSAAITEEKPGFARARAEKVLEPATERIEAHCPYFGRCGGCHYQHTSYEHQLKIKAAILEENFRRIAKFETLPELRVHPSPPWNYRNRTRLQVRAGHGAISGRGVSIDAQAGEDVRPSINDTFALGFFMSSSHALLPVEECPISSPLLNRAIGALWTLGRSGQIPAELREVELLANADDTQLQVELYCDPRTDKLRRTETGEDLAEQLCAVIPEVVSAYVLAQSISPMRTAHGHITEELDWSLGAGEFRYRTKAASFRVSGGSFFQVNRFLVDELVALVAGGRSGEIALDLYAGVGLFSSALASSFRHIVAVEWSQSSLLDLKYNSPANVKAVRSTVDEYLATQGAKMRPNLVVVDPPRAGLGERVSRALTKMDASRLTYVSCDPATLARDLIHLRAGGYRVEQAHLVDLFPQTYHLETVLHLVR